MRNKAKTKKQGAMLRAVRSKTRLGELQRRMNEAYDQFVAAIGTPEEPKAHDTFVEARREYETAKFA